jgi:hypothetical protein
MIDLEDAKVWIRIAARKRVEPRTEHDILPDTGCNGRRHAIFRDATSHGQERAKTGQDHSLGAPRGTGVESGLRFGT